MLFLSKENLMELCDFNELVTVVEESMRFYDTGKFVMPDRIRVQKEEETYLYMPCFTDDIKGTKILTLYPQNVANGKDTIKGLMLLNDIEDGSVKCILEGATLTAYRTGAVGGCGIKYTTADNADSIGIVGAGVQAYYQCLFATKLRNIKTIYILNTNSKRANDLKARLEKDTGCTVFIASSAYELLQNCKIILTATTSFEPVLPNDADLLKNHHFIGIGSYKPNMREFPDALFSLLDEVYIDVVFAKEETGDLLYPIEHSLIDEKNIHTLTKCFNKKPTSSTTFYKSVGMAMFDIYVADYFYKKAKEKGIGTEVDM